MRPLVWTVFTLGLLLWTAATWGIAEALRWAAGLLTPGQPIDWATAIGQIRFPAWLLDWLDAALLEQAIGAVVGALEATRQAAPWLGSALGWATPLLWAVWALGALLWLALAGGLHVLVGRTAAPPVVP